MYAFFAAFRYDIDKIEDVQHHQINFTAEQL